MNLAGCYCKFDSRADTICDLHCAAGKTIRESYREIYWTLRTTQAFLRDEGY